MSKGFLEEVFSRFLSWLFQPPQPPWDSDNETVAGKGTAPPPQRSAQSGAWEERRQNRVLIPANPPVYFSTLWRGRSLGMVNDMYLGMKKAYADQTLEHYLGTTRVEFQEQDIPYNQVVADRWKSSELRDGVPVAEQSNDGKWRAFTCSRGSSHAGSIRFWTEIEIDLDQKTIIERTMSEVSLD